MESWGLNPGQLVGKTRSLCTVLSIWLSVRASAENIHTYSPVSLSRTLLIIWIAFLFRASGFTKPSPTEIQRGRKKNTQEKLNCHYSSADHPPHLFLLQMITVVNVEQDSLRLYPQKIMRTSQNLCCSKAVLLLHLRLTPLPGTHSCCFLNELTHPWSNSLRGWTYWKNE